MFTMNDDERKPRLHINLGMFIILIIIILILFKVDIKSKIQSKQFQDNYSYIVGSIKDIWQNKIVAPIKAKTGDTFVNFTNSKLEELQKDFTKNILKEDPNTDTEKDVSN